MLDKPFVSIVTPFYNTSEYIGECIESVISQTYQNWEYLLVDNCSTDGSYDIAIEYSKRDNRIKVIKNQYFMTQVQNYNHALEQISDNSKYCKIVQADDFIFPRCIEEMVNVAEMSNAISLVGSYYLRGNIVEGSGLPCQSNIIRGKTVCRMHLIDGIYLFGSPTSVMYLAELVRARKPFYTEDSYLEDTEVCYELLKEYDFGFVHQVLTFTRTDNESISSAVKNYNPDLLSKYILVNKYGKYFLNDSEYDECMDKASKRYFVFLGIKKLINRDNKFWDYHYKAINKLGCNVSNIKLLTSVMSVIINNITKPSKFIKVLTS